MGGRPTRWPPHAPAIPPNARAQVSLKVQIEQTRAFWAPERLPPKQPLSARTARSSRESSRAQTFVSTMRALPPLTSGESSPASPRPPATARSERDAPRAWFSPQIAV